MRSTLHWKGAATMACKLPLRRSFQLIFGGAILRQQASQGDWNVIRWPRESQAESGHFFFLYFEFSKSSNLGLCAIITAVFDALICLYYSLHNHKWKMGVELCWRAPLVQNIYFSWLEDSGFLNWVFRRFYIFQLTCCDCARNGFENGRLLQTYGNEPVTQFND